MKTKLTTAIATAIVGVGLVATNAMALPLTGALQDALNDRTQGGLSSVDVQTDMLSDTSDSAWSITGNSQSAATLLFEFAGYKNTNAFGIYNLSDHTQKLEMFSGPDNNNGTPFQGAFTTLSYFAGTFSVDNFTTSIDFGSAAFGFYLDVNTTGNTYFSDTSLNTDQYDHMFAYEGQDDQFSVFNNSDYATWNDNEFILAWEDLPGGGDQDFTDFVVMVESVEPVPEPSTMLLFGAGLAGLAAVARRKKTNK